MGKTTCAASTALNLAESGLRILIVSLDPAHNLGDVLALSLGDKPKEVARNLHAMEVDMEGMVKSYLSGMTDMVRHMYRYLTVLNLDKFIDILRYSPGIEEYATLEAISDVLLNNRDFEVIVFDTPPTGLTLRVLALPLISLMWVERLIDIRKRILGLRAAIENIKGERVLEIEGYKERLPSREEDPVMKELKKYKRELEEVKETITNPGLTSVAAVLNPESLPLWETERAFETLKKFKIPLKIFIVNKVLQIEEPPPELKAKLREQAEVLQRVEERFQGYPIVHSPMQGEEIRGVERLKGFPCPASAFFMEHLKVAA